MNTVYGYLNGSDDEMDRKLLDEVIACLPKDRTVFRYAQDDYALMLLSRIAGEGAQLAEIRRSAYSRLLGKPRVQRLLADRGNGVVSRSVFDSARMERQQEFLLTVGCWNEQHCAYNQTTRRGGNLVLQVNFNAGHDREFMRVVGPSGRGYFSNRGHPVLREGDRRYFRHTMAWVRLDVDFEAGEMLIEEVQTDWLRDARWFLRHIEWCAKNKRDRLKDKVVNGRVDEAVNYVRKTLAPYFGMWDEAALTAAIEFVVDELGIRRIYYHSYETGNALKKIRYRLPPRSLYTDLPRRFCFGLTDQVPDMLARSAAVRRKLKRIRQPHWYRLDLSEQKL